MNKIAKELRIKCLELSGQCQDGNLQSVFSCIDIVWSLYDKIMNWSTQKATCIGRDFFIISKGQATLALFSVLIKKGFLEEDELEDIGEFNSKFSIQTDTTKFFGGVENSAGSLGHGFPYAAGIAFANKIKKLSSKVYVLVGDGEFCEGTMWESCLFAHAKQLDNLYVIIDDNDSVGSMIDVGSMKDKLCSFGFEVKTVDGHSMENLEKVFKSFREVGKPKALIAKTVRGYGSKTMMKDDIWFHKAPTQGELGLLIKEVEEFEKDIFEPSF